MKPILHFAHGNGFPSPCYKQLLQGMQPHFRICYIDKIGHDARYPVTENWQHLVTEVLESIKTQANEPVFALGHSLGGVLSYLAAVQEPSLFRGIVLLDSPMIGSFKSLMIRLAKAMGLIEKLSPAKRTRGRQQFWHSREQLIRYLHKRELFKNFSPACLQDYIDYGLEKRDDGYHLRFDRQIEAEIYKTIPHSLPRMISHQAVPATLLYGLDSTVIDRFDRSYMWRKLGIPSQPVAGGHLFPFEHPEAAVAAILQVLSRQMG